MNRGNSIMTHPQMEMTVFVRRHKPNGSMMLVPCVMSQLTMEDVDEAIRLHDEVAHGLSKEIFIPSPEDEIRRFLGDEGLSVGVKYDGKLICLRTAVVGQEWSREMAVDMGLPAEEGDNAACTGFCVVDKAFRGNNVQFLTQYYAENLIAMHHDKILTTVSPHNIFSSQNVLNCNYRIITIKEIYNGHIRYVLEKELRPEFPLWTHWHLQISIHDFYRQRKAIAAGAVGYKLVRKPSGMHVLYATTGNFPHWAKDLHID